MQHNGNSAAGLQRCQILDLPPEGLASSRGAGANSYQCDQLSYAQDKVIDRGGDGEETLKSPTEKKVLPHLFSTMKKTGEKCITKPSLLF